MAGEGILLFGRPDLCDKNSASQCYRYPSKDCSLVFLSYLEVMW